MRFYFILSIVCCALFLNVHCEESAEEKEGSEEKASEEKIADETIILTDDNFDEVIKTNNFFVKFYAPWCGHCQVLAPTWSELAGLLNKDPESRIRIAKVDCTVSAKTCTANDIGGYPTLKFFNLNSDKEPVKYRSSRDLPALTQFINEQLGMSADEELDTVTEAPEVPEAPKSLFTLTESTFADHIATGKHFVKFYAPWCAHCKSMSVNWDQLADAMEYDETVTIGKVDCTENREVCKSMEIKGYPTLLWIEDGKKVEKYAGGRSLESMKKYVEKMASGDDVAPKSKPEEPEATEEKDDSLVIDFNNDNFEHGIEKGVSFVEFFAPWCGHCKRLKPTWDQLADKFSAKTDVTIARVDCTLADCKDLCAQEKVQGFPTLYIYKDGKQLSEYTGSRSLEDLVEFVEKNIVDKHDEL